MSALQLYEGSKYAEKAIQSLSLAERRVAVYSFPNDENPRIGNMNGGSLKGTCAAILARAALRLGTPEKKDQEYVNWLLVISEDLRNLFPALTYKELFLALDNGLNGEYKNKPTDFVHFSPSNLVQWINAYIQQTKVPVISKLITAQEVEEKKVEIEAPSRKKFLESSFTMFVKSCINQVENGVVFEDHGGLIYDLFLLLKVIPPVDPEGDKMKEASMILFNRATDSMDRSRIKEAQNIRNLTMQGKYSDKVFATARRRAVMEKMAEICTWDEGDIADYLEFLKESLIEYIKENNLTDAP